MLTGPVITKNLVHTGFLFSAYRFFYGCKFSAYRFFYGCKFSEDRFFMMDEILVSTGF